MNKDKPSIEANQFAKQEKDKQTNRKTDSPSKKYNRNHLIIQNRRTKKLFRGLVPKNKLYYESFYSCC